MVFHSFLVALIAVVALLLSLYSLHKNGNVGIVLSIVLPTIVLLIYIFSINCEWYTKFNILMGIELKQRYFEYEDNDENNKAVK